jgi:hypothetical protein
VEYSYQALIIAINDGGKGENHLLRGLLPVSYNLFIRNNINYKLIGGIKIHLKISIFYGEKVVHLADF